MMNDCPFALHGFLILYIACVVMGCCPVTGAIFLATTYASTALAD